MQIHVHIHNSDTDKKFDKILELIEKWHEMEIEEVIKKLRDIKKDIKSTPIK